MEDFAAATSWPATGEGGFAAVIPESWSQGRTLFGGLTAAAGLRAMRSLVAAERLPRSVHVDLVAPIAGAGAELRVDTVREGKSISNCRARFVCGEQLCAQVTAAFAAPRSSVARVTAPARPPRPGPEELPEMPFLPGMTPNFTGKFAYRWTDGALPFSGASETTVAGWCRHRTTPGPPHEAILGLVDAWPSPMLALLPGPAPSSTVSWTTTFIEVPDRVGVDEWWWFDCRTLSAGDGYASVRGELYGPDGSLAADFSQLVAVFA